MSVAEKKLGIDRVVFIGRTFEEYRAMFNLNEKYLKGKKVLDCASGACSFTAHALQQGTEATSCDIAYKFTAEELEKKGSLDLIHTMNQMQHVQEQYVWKYFSSIDDLTEHRKRALKDCIAHMKKNPEAYQYGALPNLPFQKNEFDLTICANFLFMYSDRLDYTFHLETLKELIRVTKEEVRFFPLTNLSGKISTYLPQLLEEIAPLVKGTEIADVPYEFQKGANQMLKIYV
ncbi:SAM-dependent methyltransferase [Priestia megaterium]|uniref:SAM-dependent methyltransferase n=1 Tax=Priestia megaterium TaxID=1404 RepID=UPI000E14B28A|nr:SAM-dependent methyltransferase [Priestia megaterium]QDZ80322.1 SAM-dependent methyltransferase [Priestia megaterium]SUV07072.1 S-adenosylmethionine (SAM)-dependent methyltransferase [Priestia megaterium]